MDHTDTYSRNSILRIIVCFMVGIAYILFAVFAATLIQMLFNNGEEDPDGIIGLMFGVITSPIPIFGAWKLYSNKALRYIFYGISLLAIIPVTIILIRIIR